MYLDYSKLPFDAHGAPEPPVLLLKTAHEAAIGVIPAAAEAADGDAGAEDGDADATEAAETPAETAVPDTPDDDKGDA